MTCYMCKKDILDDHFKKTKRHYYHLDECWWKAKKFYSVVVPSIFGVAILWGIIILFLELILEGLI